MSSSETEIAWSSSESDCSKFSDDDHYCSIFKFEPYQFEPLARPDEEQAATNIYDEDGLSQRTLTSRYDREVPLNQW